MRLLLSTAIAIIKVISTSADDPIIKQHGSLQYVDNFLSPEESKNFNDDMDILQQNTFDPDATFLGHVLVNELIQQRIKDVAGSEFSIDDSIIANDDGSIMMQTRIIDESTNHHVDYRDDEAVEDDVMFITLNSNPDAYFTHDGNSLPVVAGRLLRFAGNGLHGTTLNGGDPIRLLGPFSIKNFASVGTRALLEETPIVPVSSTMATTTAAATTQASTTQASTTTPETTSQTSTTMATTQATTTTAAQSTTQASTTQASTTTPETTSQTSTTIATTTQATTTTTTTPSPSLLDLFNLLVEDLGLPPLVAILIIILVIFGVIDAGDLVGMNLGAMLEDIHAEGGGIRGRRILEDKDKEDIKALLTSLLEEKLDLDEY